MAACVAEGANMPSTPEAIEAFHEAGILFAPGKASNAGGVATWGLKCPKNSLRYNWTREEVDAKLHHIMKDIHGQCVAYGPTKTVQSITCEARTSLGLSRSRIPCLTKVWCNFAA